MKVYGHPMSTCTRKVLTTLEEIGMVYEIEVIDFSKGEHKQRPHLDRQPFGQIPTIEDNGFQLYESRAICRYLDEKVGGKIIPKDIQGRGRMEQWISIETSNFTPAAMKFIYEHVFQRKQDEAVLAAAHTTLGTALDVMDRHLAQSPYMAGEAFTLADICFMPYVEYLMPTPVKNVVTERANVAAWWTRVSERPTWRKVTGKNA
jgi:glutathione S-transferase